MAAVKIKMPYFCRGTKAKLQAALDEGGIFYTLDRIIWCYDPENNHLYFVNIDKIIHEMVGDNETLVRRVDSLPPISDAQVNILYILNKTVYTFDGEAFYPTYQDVSEDITEVKEKIAEFAITIEDMQSAITTNTSNIETLQATTTTLSENLEVVDGKTDEALAALENVYTKDEVYTKSDTYTKSEVDGLMGDLVDPETGEKIDVKDYVDTAVESAISVTKV